MRSRRLLLCVAALGLLAQAGHAQVSTRPETGSYAYVVIDARYESVHQGGQVLDAAVLLALGVRADGKRELLGVSSKLSEAEVHWREFLTGLKDRGLHGVKLFVSDDHAGLKAARKAVFPSVPWQRCQFHLQQNAAAYVPQPPRRRSRSRRKQPLLRWRHRRTRWHRRRALPPPRSSLPGSAYQTGCRDRPDVVPLLWQRDEDHRLHH